MANILQLRGINQTYKDKKGDFVLFKDLDFTIEDNLGRGQFVVLMGKSGCGKSTLLRYFSQLQTPTSGEVLINDRPITDKDTIPMVFQIPSSLEWYSVLDNVALPLVLKGTSKKEANEKAMEMIKVVGLEGHERKYAKYPLLSGGQLQRVAIARSLVANPSMILMDEPFSALDVTNRRNMQKFLQKMYWDGQTAGLDPTIVLVTHDCREAAFLANDIYIMGTNPGRICEHIEVDLDHTTDVKKTPRFIELVDHIEQTLDNL